MGACGQGRLVSNGISRREVLIVNYRRLEVASDNAAFNQVCKDNVRDGPSDKKRHRGENLGAQS